MTGASADSGKNESEETEFEKWTIQTSDIPDR